MMIRLRRRRRRRLFSHNISQY